MELWKGWLAGGQGSHVLSRRRDERGIQGKGWAGRSEKCKDIGTGVSNAHKVIERLSRANTHFFAASAFKFGAGRKLARNGVCFFASLYASLASSLTGSFSFSFFGLGPNPCSGTVTFIPKKPLKGARVVLDLWSEGRGLAMVCVDGASRTDVLLGGCQKRWKDVWKEGDARGINNNTRTS
jgi:hypothetical protein